MDYTDILEVPVMDAAAIENAAKGGFGHVECNGETYKIQQNYYGDYYVDET